MKEDRKEVRYREDEERNLLKGVFFVFFPLSLRNVFIGPFHLNDFSFTLAIALPLLDAAVY